MNLKLGEIQTFVTDVADAVDFYKTKLNLRLKQVTKEWAIFDISGTEFVVMGGAKSKCTDTYASSSRTVMCLQSNDIESDIEFLKAQKVHIFQDIQTVPQGKFAVIQDPAGNFIEIIQH